MRKNYVLYFTAVILFNSAFAFAQYTDDQKQSGQGAPSGMDVRKVNNDVSVLVPKGGQMHQTNNTTFTLESSDEYAARNFASLDTRVKKLEEENRALIEEIKYLESKLVLQEKGTDKDAAKPAQE